MKIVILTNDSTYVYNLRREVIAEMRARKWQVSIVCEEWQHIEDLCEMGCELIPVETGRHGKNPFSDLQLKHFYGRILKQKKPDIVLTYNIKPNVYGGMECARLKIPYLANVCGLGTPLTCPGPMRLLTSILYKMGLRKASCVFFQNTENEKFFNDRNMAPGHHHLLPGSGVNTSRYAVMEYPDGETIDFLFIARVMKNKGIDQYLDAAKAIKAQYPNTVFHIVGGCDDERYIKELQELEGKGIVKYHGQQNSVLPFQKISSCTIHPTYYPEGMSNVLLESAACARPIITTDRSGCREIIDDGVNGFICKQKDSADLIRQIEKFLALTWEQRRDMGLAGRAKVEREFDRQLVVDAYMEEIEVAKV